MIEILAALILQPATQPKAPPKVDAPKQEAAPALHPLITEILYAVPPREAGDANGDGKRDVNGDEFIELVNPHDKPIQIGGYTITDRDIGEGEKKFTSIRFKFPVCELKPGQVAVVFNGHGQKWTGPVGDANKAPSGGNDKFHNALVFTMGIASEKMGLANKGDCVQLASPDGKVVDCIHWGEAKPNPRAEKNEEAPLINAQSVERPTATGSFAPHPGSVAFSPGQWPGPSEAPAPTDNTKPAEPAPKTNPPSPDKK